MNMVELEGVTKTFGPTTAVADLSLAVNLVVGFASGLLPARRAAALDPLVALAAE
jgi:ABC-type antimicrobial peptide transport system permease subunit